MQIYLGSTVNDENGKLSPLNGPHHEKLQRGMKPAIFIITPSHPQAGPYLGGVSIVKNADFCDMLESRSRCAMFVALLSGDLWHNRKCHNVHCTHLKHCAVHLTDNPTWRIYIRTKECCEPPVSEEALRVH